MKGFQLYLEEVKALDEGDDWSDKYLHYDELKNRIQYYSKRRRGWNGGDVALTPLRTTTDGQSTVAATTTTASIEATGCFAVPESVYALHTDADDDDDINNVPSYIGKLYEELDEEELESVRNQLAAEERTDFLSLLRPQLIECTRWYQQKVKELTTSDGSNKTDSVRDCCNVYTFAVANILCIRQLLHRYNAYTQTFNGTHMSLSEWDLQQDHSSFRTLLELGDLREVKAHLQLELMAAKNEMEAQNQLEQTCKTLEDILDRTQAGVEKAAVGHAIKRDRILGQLRTYFSVGSSRFGYSLEPRMLTAKGRNLKKDMKHLIHCKMAASRGSTGIFSESGGDDDESVVNTIDPRNVWPLVLNLISCFLFMMNNYIIEPSSAYYANSLGSSDALSGIMIGAAPWFALLSAIGYSIWTNTSYKTPILFAGGLMVVGNTLYAAAYSYKSMGLCLIGRAITGLGAPRVINRRYVADATPFALRTMSSAAFAMVTALGAALGPGVAILLDWAPEFQFNLPLLGTQYFNGMTGPGYFMAVCWFIYSLAVLFTFQEPHRSGLDELKRREAKKKEDITDSKAESLMIEGIAHEEDDDDASTDADSQIFDAHGDDEQTPSVNSPRYCIKHITRATALCMGLIFMKRIALECIVGSTSVITKNRYGWSIQDVGLLHLVNGLVVIPISIFAGWLSQFYQDRFLATCWMVITACGMLILVDLSDLADHDSSETYNADAMWSVGPGRYIAGSLVAFSGIEACESFVASLMSKVVPSALAIGTFNSGLLATLVGTSGRAVGDLMITAMGLLSIRNLLNLLILPGLCLVLISLVLLLHNYRFVAV